MRGALNYTPNSSSITSTIASSPGSCRTPSRCTSKRSCQNPSSPASGQHVRERLLVAPDQVLAALEGAVGRLALVRAVGPQRAGLERDADVLAGDVEAHREPGLEHEAGLGALGHEDAVALEPQRPGAAADVDAVERVARVPARRARPPRASGRPRSRRPRGRAGRRGGSRPRPRNVTGSPGDVCTVNGMPGCRRPGTSSSLGGAGSSAAPMSSAGTA